MVILSVNLGEKKEVAWRGNTVTTGIFKEPVNEPIYLEKTDVRGDQVVDRRYHGGENKACYLYGANHYPYWQEKYPEVATTFGLMGENLTVDSCREEQLLVGSIYKVGGAVVQIVQPRQPCFKLGIKFNTQKVLKDFIQYAHPGVYFRILEEGQVTVGDTFELQEASTSTVTVQQLFSALYQKPSPSVQEAIRQNEAIPQDLRAYVESRS